jgi:hypothetical protein
MPYLSLACGLGICRPRLGEPSCKRIVEFVQPLDFQTMHPDGSGLFPHRAKAMISLTLGRRVWKIEKDFKPVALEEGACEDPTRSTERNARLVDDHLGRSCRVHDFDVTIPDRALLGRQAIEMQAQRNPFGGHVAILPCSRRRALARASPLRVPSPSSSSGATNKGSCLRAVSTRQASGRPVSRYETLDKAKPS